MRSNFRRGLHINLRGRPSSPPSTAPRVSPFLNTAINWSPREKPAVSVHVHWLRALGAHAHWAATKTAHRTQTPVQRSPLEKTTCGPLEEARDWGKRGWVGIEGNGVEEGETWRSSPWENFLIYFLLRFNLCTIKFVFWNYEFSGI